MTTARAWYDAHQDRLRSAMNAIRCRHAHTAFQESPSRKHHPEGAKARGQAAFESLLGSTFHLEGDVRGHVGAERSPWTGEALDVRYPKLVVDDAIDRARRAMKPFADAGPEARIGVCLEILARLEADLFLATFATQATTGQGFMMAFAGSGANSLDRGLEGLAMAAIAMEHTPAAASFTRSFGHGGPITLHKRYHLRPRGVAVVLSCGTYPAWNAYPALFANLATGNPVVLKPHPNTILPMALAVRTCQQVLAEAGFEPELVTLAPDDRDDPIAKPLLQHPDVRIIDFTGGQTFGDWIETTCRQAQVYTETSGCNSVVLASSADLDASLAAIAQSLALFSAQMCTSAQNLFIPETVRDGDRWVDHDEVVERLVARVDADLAQPAHASAICGALFDERVATMVQGMHDRAPVLRPSGAIADPAFPRARTATPLILEADVADRAIVQQEHFGPVSFVIRCPDRRTALAAATEDARRFGAIASYAYTVDPPFQDAVEEAFVDAGASVGINLHAQRPINFSAAYSDHHVTGLNPAGNATLTDLAFVADRFRIVQSKREIG
jgi:phenylacetic acid degradation protein paaN